MSELVETARRLGPGQQVILTLVDGQSVEARVSQMESVPDNRLRIELTADDSSDRGRIQLETHFEDGRWAPLNLKQFDPARGEWTPLGDVASATPAEMFRTMRSMDMEAQRETGDYASTNN